MFQELEIMAMQKGSRSALDLSKLDKQQLDKVLETMSENEKNAFSYHSKRLDAIKEIELRRIDASVINQKTIKIVLIGVLIFVLPAITLLILFFKETFFIPLVDIPYWHARRFWVKQIFRKSFQNTGNKKPD